MALKAILTPPPIHVRRYARLGLIPHAGFESEMGSALNFVGASRQRNLFTYAVGIDDIPDSNPLDTRTRWRFAAHSHPLLYRIRAMIQVARMKGSDASDPSVKLTITNADESVTYGSGSVSFGNAVSGTTSDVPSEFGWFEVRIADIPADSDIYGRIDDVTGGRVLGITVYEEPLDITGSNGFIEPASVSVQGSILDSRRQAAMELATELWNRAAAPLWHFTVDDQDSPFTVAGGTANIIDGTSSSVSASTPGATIDLRYCRTRSNSTVPCAFKAWAYMSGSSETAEVRLVDSTGTAVATLEINGTTPQWYETTVSLPSTLGKYELVGSNAGAETLSVGACSLYQYA